MPLTHLECLNAKPKTKTYKLFDENGLFLQVYPTGSKHWRYRYSLHGKQKSVTLGSFPDTTLIVARETLETVKSQLKEHIDPHLKQREERQLAKYQSAQTFKSIAKEWHELNKDSWSEKHAKYVLRRLELHTFPQIGSYPIAQLTPAMMMACLQKVEKSGSEMTRRVMRMCSHIFQYGIATGRGDRDLTIGLKYGLKKYKSGHYAAVTLDELPDLVKKIYWNDARLFKQTHLCLKLMLFTAVRTCELIEARWAEIDLEKAIWIIPAQRMKTRKLHKVPLSTQALALLQQLKEMNGKRDFVFPSIPRPRKPMSNATILKALDNLGYKNKMTGHGFRSVFMGVCKQHLGYRHEPVDRQLAHAPRNSVDRAYDRADYLPERIIIMQHYADYIEGLTQPTERKTHDEQRSDQQSNRTAFKFSDSAGYAQQYQPIHFKQSYQNGETCKAEEKRQIERVDSSTGTTMH